jgi:hypothetical protein
MIAARLSTTPKPGHCRHAREHAGHHHQWQAGSKENGVAAVVVVGRVPHAGNGYAGLMKRCIGFAPSAVNRFGAISRAAADNRRNAGPNFPTGSSRATFSHGLGEARFLAFQAAPQARGTCVSPLKTRCFLHCGKNRRVFSESARIRRKRLADRAVGVNRS